MENRKWVTRQDGLDRLVLKTETLPPAPLPAGHVLVKIHAVALNFRDTEVCMGLYSHHRAIASGGIEPLVPCSDMCGTVVDVGPDAVFETGDRVVSVFNHLHQTGHMRAEYMAAGLGLPLDGVLQTYRVFPAAGLMPAPTHLTDAEAACLPIASVTAWMSLQPFPLEGKTVLVQGTGGVSVAGARLAKAAGATVVVTSSSDAKLEMARSLLGADHVINYKATPQWADEVMRLTDGHGADCIFDNGGAATLRQSFDAVAFGGTINCIGYLGGKTARAEEADGDLCVSVLALRRNVVLRGILNGPRDEFAAMLDFYETHQLRPLVHCIFGFDESVDALQYLYSGQHFGKVVIQVT